MNNRKAKILKMFGVREDSIEWNDWHWQYKNRICDTEKLSSILNISDKEKNDITSCLAKFRMAVTPYYASLMEDSCGTDPIRTQAIPAINEMEVYPWEMPDPLDEQGASPVKNIVHRYPDRVLFLVTKRCATYCRHCSRRRFTGEEDSVISNEETEIALEYIRKRPQIRDVLISGGDPLTMPDAQLDSILSKLREIKHVEIIRIGTRIPVTMPMRITAELLITLKNYQPLWINTHFNHPKELTEDSERACSRIVDAGIPLGNQSVLLKGINDNADVMKELLLKLVKARVRPYCLYQCELVEGLEHFRTDVRTGINIIQSLSGNISGIAVPVFVIDAPGGGGKITISPDNIISLDNEKIIMRNYQGKNYAYPQPSRLAACRI